VLATLDEETLDLSIQSMTELLQQDVHIGDMAWMLANGGDSLEDARDISEIKVPTDGETFRTPIAPADHGVHEG
jgi:hypothetical protein